MHSLIVKEGFDSDRYVGNTLLRMYSGCGAIGFARQVFDGMCERDVVSWSSMIAGYVAWYNAFSVLTFTALEMVRKNEIKEGSHFSLNLTIFYGPGGRVVLCNFNHSKVFWISRFKKIIRGKS